MTELSIARAKVIKRHKENLYCYLIVQLRPNIDYTKRADGKMRANQRESNHRMIKDSILPQCTVPTLSDTSFFRYLFTIRYHK